jgi:SAM-dependent methyltransferase
MVITRRQVLTAALGTSIIRITGVTGIADVTGTTPATAAAAAVGAGQRRPSRTPDVFFAPSRPALIDAMLKLAEVTADDVVYDLGSGDGRILIRAAQKYGARGVGIELDPQLVELSRQIAVDGEVADRVTFLEADFFNIDLSSATVVTLFLSESINTRLEPKFKKELKPGTRIVSQRFGMRTWAPERTITVLDEAVHLWRIPGR